MDARPEPHSYRAEVRRLRQRVAQLERQLRLAGRPLPGAFDDECLECGAKPGEPCTTATNYAFEGGGKGHRQRRHHLRGRTEPCGKPSCSTCVRYFEREAAE